MRHVADNGTDTVQHRGGRRPGHERVHEPQLPQPAAVHAERTHVHGAGARPPGHQRREDTPRYTAQQHHQVSHGQGRP